MFLKLKRQNINNLVKVQHDLSNSKTKVDDLDIEKFNVSVDLRQLTNVVGREVVKNTKGIKSDKKKLEKNLLRAKYQILAIQQLLLILIQKLQNLRTKYQALVVCCSSLKNWRN